MRILMVEDSEDDALLVARELRRAGYEPAITRIDNASALQHELHTGQWDVLLSDYFVPGLPIETALRIAREYAPELPFIIVSGAIGEERAVSVMRLGAQDFIMKGRLARLAPAIERELLESENRQQRRLAEVEIAGLNRTLGRRLQELEKVLEVVPVGICMADDPACTDIRINPAMARILHVPLTSGPLQSAPQASASEMQLFPRSSPAGAQQSPMLAAVRTGEPQENIELNIRRQDGVVVHLFGSAAPLLDEAGHVRGCVAAYVDMSDRRAAEAALRNAEKLATVGRLAATIAHEINNPLEAVTNVLYLISRSPKLDAALRQYVTIAQAELDRIGTIVRHTLGFHR
ncbi:MAG TPA: histidine kinase dimerization/phospho-acceptor domain-containing protein, partial [Terriglobales bacterium]|nr:histidine kinase dimerization/phospho-acceptor domain-containing protein [Terriglobales bacterium]